MTGGSAFHVTATGVVDSGPGGILHVVAVNAATSGATLTLHDGGSSSGPVIAAVTASAPVGLTYDAVIVNGLYGVVSGTIDATVVILPAPDSGD